MRLWKINLTMHIMLKFSWCYNFSFRHVQASKNMVGEYAFLVINKFL